MNIGFDRPSGTITVPAATLASFARRRVAGRSNMIFASAPDDEAANLPLADDGNLCRTVDDGGFTFTVYGTADGVTDSGEHGAVWKCFPVQRLFNGISPYTYPEIAAEAVVLADILCTERGWQSAEVIITLVSGNRGDTKTFRTEVSAALAEAATAALWKRFIPFGIMAGKNFTETIPTLKNVPFPYKNIREGQRDFINEVYRRGRAGERLLVTAPTGIGKTISALYPALRLMGDGTMDKIFYLTAKNITGLAALSAVRDMNALVPGLRAVMVCAKERVCPARSKDSVFETDECGWGCPRMGDEGGLTYNDRRDSALVEILSSATVYTTEMIDAVCEKHKLCPYEFSLDLSEHCHVVVCDYNYAFDLKVRFQRYFLSDDGKKYIFLVDEAHNLCDRAREMYSAELNIDDVTDADSQYRKLFPEDSPLHSAVSSLICELDGVRRSVLYEAVEDSDGVLRGISLEKEVPQGLLAAAGALKSVIYDRLRRRVPEHEKLLPLYSVLSHLANAASVAEDRHTFYATAEGEDVRCKLLCLDPSVILDRMMNAAASAMLFSATLTPMDYFADVLGCSDAARLELDSPYDSDNLCLVAVDTVSVRYSRRMDSVYEAAEMIAETVWARQGNYIVYSPSYEYMKQVAAVCRDLLEGSAGIIVQKSGMSAADRERFLRAFSENRDSTLVAFCVLGGMFGEGIDLRGEKLIGTVILGVGMPRLSTELNIISEYYERTRENGHDYTYVYPGLIKVLQAAGRVIRSESDRGVVVLMDERYGERSMWRLLPSHWRHMKLTGDPDSLGEILRRFWDEGD